MIKIGHEIKFENNYQTALTQLQLLRKKPSQDKVNNIKGLVKDLEKCISNIEQTFYANTKINKKDAENKVSGYKEQKNSLKSSVDAIELSLQQKELMRHISQAETPTGDKLKYDNREWAEKQKEQLNNVHKLLNEAGGIVKNTAVELEDQHQLITKIDEDAEDADMELSMINEFMGILSNRNLLTKVILVLLAIFLGVADLIIILLKIA